LQLAFSASSGGENRTETAVKSLPLSSDEGAPQRLSGDPREILACTSTDHIRRGTNRAFAAASRPYFFLSTSAVPRGCSLFGAAIRRRPICRTGTRIGRHSVGYLGTERGTITNINIQRPRSLWWYGVSRQLRPVAKNLTSLQHPPCRSAKRTYSVSSSCSLPPSLPFSLSLSLDPLAILRFARHLALFLLVGEVPSWPGPGHAGNHFFSDTRCFARSVIPKPENMEREISTARSWYTFSVYLPLCLAARSRAENTRGRLGREVRRPATTSSTAYPFSMME